MPKPPNADAVYAMRPIIKRQTPEIYKAAMLAGYLGETDKVSLPEIAGSKHSTFTLHEWTVTDTYCVSPICDNSMGTTVVSYLGIPVWILQYGGYYPKSAIPFLKEALAEGLKNDTGIGGRGASIFTREGMIYTNTITSHTNDSTRGTEQVFTNDTRLGYHSYHGLWLLDW